MPLLLDLGLPMILKLKPVVSLSLFVSKVDVTKLEIGYFVVMPMKSLGIPSSLTIWPLGGELFFALGMLLDGIPPAKSTGFVLGRLLILPTRVLFTTKSVIISLLLWKLIVGSKIPPPPNWIMVLIGIFLKVFLKPLGKNSSVFHFLKWMMTSKSFSLAFNPKKLTSILNGNVFWFSLIS